MDKQIDLYKKLQDILEVRDSIYKKICFTTFRKCGKLLRIKYPIHIIGGKYIELGDNVILDRNVRMEAWDEYSGVKYNPKIIVGNNVCFNPDCHIGCINKMKIGNNVLIGAGVLITDHSHGKINTDALKKVPNMRRLYSKGNVIIQDNVWIGERAVILSGVTIGKNAIIGANAVVTKDIPDNAVVVGSPAKVIKILS